MARISVIIPAINEEDGIGKTISAIPFGELKKNGHETEVLVIDGNSTDRTVEVSENAGARVIVEPRKGYGRAYKTGFDKAVGEIFITADADHTYPVEDIPELLEYMYENKVDFLTTDRFKMMSEGAMSGRNKLGNNVLSITSRTLFGAPFNDSQSGMWLLKRGVWERIRDKVKSDGMPFSQEIKIEACRSGFKCDEVGIRYRKRHGEVKLNPWRDGIGNLAHLFKKRIS